MSKTSRNRFLLLYSGLLALLLGIGLIAVVVTDPDRKPPCPKGDKICGEPPKPPTGADALVNGVVWKSDLGARMEYYPNLWEVVENDPRDLKLKLALPGRSDLDLFVWVRVAPTSEGPLSQLVDDRIGSLKDDILALKEDTSLGAEILSPAIGYLDGIGAAHQGAADTPQGPGNPVHVLLMAAHDDKVSAVVTAASTSSERSLFGLADTLLNTFRFPSQLGDT